MNKKLLTNIASVALCFILACTILWASSTTTFTTSTNSYYGREAVVKKLVVTVTPTAADDNSISSTAIMTEPIYGELKRITLAATGTDSNFTVIVKDDIENSLFERTDCNTVNMPYNHALILYPYAATSTRLSGILVAGLLTVDTNNVDPNNLTSITISIYYFDFKN